MEKPYIANKALNRIIEVLDKEQFANLFDELALIRLAATVLDERCPTTTTIQPMYEVEHTLEFVYRERLLLASFRIGPGGLSCTIQVENNRKGLLHHYTTICDDAYTAWDEIDQNVHDPSGCGGLPSLREVAVYLTSSSEWANG